MVKLDVSDKVSSVGSKLPYVKKGYYPGALVDAKVRMDKTTNQPFVGKFGRQLILKFRVYETDATGKPTKPMVSITKMDSGATVEQPLEFVSFPYYEYKDQKTGLFSSAITPNSNLTKILVNLGWKFSAKEQVDIDSFLGKFVELNLDDYEATAADGTKYKASSIKAINKYEGPAVDIKVDKASEMTEDDIDVIDA
jgi:hypothetical protein